jgi:hypothetical protein
MRQRGSRNLLVKIDYDLIGDLAGVAGNTAKLLAHRGEYNPRDLDSLLTWLNKRRLRQGQPMIGVPADPPIEGEARVNREPDRFEPPETPPLNLSGGYDPLLGGYRTDTASRR